VLDDLGLIRQYKKDGTDFSLFKPEPAMLMNGNSELDGNSAEFDGSNTYRGVNPATGAVIYYQLPELKERKISRSILKMRRETWFVRSLRNVTLLISAMMVRLRQTPHYRNQKDLIVSFGIYVIQP
jgi:hypothetical protein